MVNSRRQIESFGSSFFRFNLALAFFIFVYFLLFSNFVFGAFDVSLNSSVNSDLSSLSFEVSGGNIVQISVSNSTFDDFEELSLDNLNYTVDLFGNLSNQTEGDHFDKNVLSSSNIDLSLLSVDFGSKEYGDDISNYSNFGGYDFSDFLNDSKLYYEYIYENKSYFLKIDTQNSVEFYGLLRSEFFCSDFSNFNCNESDVISRRFELFSLHNFTFDGYFVVDNNLNLSFTDLSFDNLSLSPLNFLNVSFVNSTGIDIFYFDSVLNNSDIFDYNYSFVLDEDYHIQYCDRYDLINFVCNSSWQDFSFLNDPVYSFLRFNSLAFRLILTDYSDVFDVFGNSSNILVENVSLNISDSLVNFSYSNFDNFSLNDLNDSLSLNGGVNVTNFNDAFNGSLSENVISLSSNFSVSYNVDLFASNSNFTTLSSFGFDNLSVNDSLSVSTDDFEIFSYSLGGVGNDVYEYNLSLIGDRNYSVVIFADTLDYSLISDFNLAVSNLNTYFGEIGLVCDGVNINCSSYESLVKNRFVRHKFRANLKFLKQKYETYEYNEIRLIDYFGTFSGFVDFGSEKLYFSNLKLKSLYFNVLKRDLSDGYFYISGFDDVKSNFVLESVSGNYLSLCDVNDFNVSDYEFGFDFNFSNVDDVSFCREMILTESIEIDHELSDYKFRLIDSNNLTEFVNFNLGSVVVNKGVELGLNVSTINNLYCNYLFDSFKDSILESVSRYDYVDSCLRNALFNISDDGRKFNYFNFSYYLFEGNLTTNFNSIVNFSSVKHFTLDDGKFGNIVFDNPVKIEGAILDSNVLIGPDFVFVNSSALDSSFNSSASITLYNVSYVDPVIFVDGSYCSDCSIISYEKGGELVFKVNHFSNYTVVSNTNLHVWDNSDDSVLNVGETIKFFANYSDNSNGNSIVGANSGCTIFETSLSGTGSKFDMIYNSSSDLYEYDFVFDISGNSIVNISCYDDSGYENLSLTENFIVNHYDEGLRVESGQYVLSGSSGFLELNNPVKSLDSAFVLRTFSFSPSSDTDVVTTTNALDLDESSVIVYLYNTTHLAFERGDGSGEDVIVDYQVVQALDDEFKVYSGFENWDSGSGTDIDINTGYNFNQSSSMVLGYTTVNGNSWSNYDSAMFRGYPISSSLIRFSRDTAESVTGKLLWYVVDFNMSKFNVFETGEVIVNSEGESSPKVVTLSNNFDVNSSLLIFQNSVATAGLDQSSVAGRIVGSNKLEFYRYYANIDREVRYYVIDFGNYVTKRVSGMEDYSGTTSIYDFDVDLNYDFDRNRSLMFNSVLSSGSGTAFPRSIWNSKFVNDSSINFYRSRTGQRNINEWQVLEFGGPTLNFVHLVDPKYDFFDYRYEFNNLTLSSNFSLRNGASNCSLWTNLSGSWSLNQTKSVVGSSGVVNFDLYNLSNTSFVWNVECFDVLSNRFTSLHNNTITLNWSEDYVGAIYTKFNGSTTDFNNHLTPDSVSNATIELVGFGKIVWNNPVYVYGQDFDSNVFIGSDFVSVDSSTLDSSFNSSANVTLYNVDFVDPVILRDGVLCGNDCSILSYVGGNLTFNVSHFTNYSVIESSSLTIGDSSDVRFIEDVDDILFYADYVNRTSGVDITGSDVYCEFVENSSGSWSNPINMSYNSSSGRYEYLLSFLNSGMFEYNISCFNNQGFANISLNDEYVVYGTLNGKGYRVESGSFVMSGTVGYVELDRPIFNIYRAFVLRNHYYSASPESVYTNGGITPDDSSVIVTLYNSTHLKFERESDVDDIVVDYQVIESLSREFKSYFGTYNWSDSSGGDIDIFVGDDVNLSSSDTFVFIYSTIDSSNYANWDTNLFRGFVLNSSYIRVKRDVVDSGVSGKLNWLVVKFDLSKIDSFQTGTAVVYDESETSPLLVNLVNTVNESKSLLLFQVGVGTSGLDQVSVAGRLVNSTTLEFYRFANNVNRNVRYYVIDFGDSVVGRQSGMLDYSGVTGNYDIDVSLGDNVNLTNSVIFQSSANDGPGTAYPRPYWISKFNNESSFNLFRSRSGQEHYNEWQVMDLSKPILFNVSLVSPLNNSIVNDNIFNDVEFYFNVSSPKSLNNCSLWTNLSGLWSFNQTKFIGGNFNSSNFTLNNLSDVDFVWNVKCCDVLNNCKFSESNFTLFVSLPNPEVINLTLNASSVDNSTFDDLYCNYNLSSSSDGGIVSWVVNGDSIASLFLAIEGNSSNALLDYSGNGNDGTCFGISCPIFNSTGANDGNGTFYFNGSQSFVVSDSPSLDLVNLTLMATFNMRNKSIGNFILDKGDSDVDDEYSLLISEDEIAFEYNDASGTSHLHTSTVANFDINTWYSVAVSVDGLNLKYYINGVNVENDTLLEPLVLGNNDLYIGQQNYPGSELYFNGSISDVRIYNRVLSDDQIYDIYAGDDNILSNFETDLFENWTCSVTPFSDDKIGNPFVSNVLMINEFRPNVTLVSPYDHYINNVDDFVNLTFKGNVTDDVGLFSCNLWTNLSGSWSLNQSISVSGVFSDFEFNLTDVGTGVVFDWNVECVDGSGRSDFGDNNWTVILDKSIDTYPFVSLISPDDYYYNISYEYTNISFVANVSDDKNLSSCNLWSNFSGLWSINKSLSLDNLGAQIEFNVTDIPVGKYIWNVECIDNASQSSFGDFNRTIVLDWLETPYVQSLIFNSSLTSYEKVYENLTCDYVLNGSYTGAVTSYGLNGSSYALIDMPFEVSSSDALMDFSANYDLVNMGGMLWSSDFGYNGTGAFEYDLDKYGSFGDVDEMDSPSAFTVSMWFKRTADYSSTESHGVRFALLSQTGDVDNLVIGTGHVSQKGYIDIFLDNAGTDFHSYDAGILTDTWYYLTVVYDFTDTNPLKLYINGNLVSQWNDLSGPIVNSGSSTLNLGISDGDADFKGYIDDFKLYTRALSSEQIYENYLNSNIIVSNETSFLDNWTCSVTPYNSREFGSTYVSDLLIVNFVNATYYNFDGLTTDFNSYIDADVISDAVIERVGYGKIEWDGLINAFDQNFTRYINISDNFIGVDSSKLHSSINSSANLTLYNLSFVYPVILRDGVFCGDDCSILSYVGGNLTFNVSHFSNYSAMEGTGLNIFDDSDDSLIYSGDYMKFYANYTNLTSGNLITGSDVVCNFSENSSGFWSSPISMSYNSTSGLYEYGDSFVVGGNFSFNVSCVNTQGYANLSLVDDFSIVGLNMSGWGINDSSFTSTTTHTSVRCMGGLSPYDKVNLTIKSFNVRMSDVSTVAFAIYSGGSEGSTTGAVKVYESLNNSAVAGWNKYYIPGGLDWGSNSSTWLCWKRSGTGGIYYSSTSTDNGDFYSSHGRNDQGSVGTPEDSFDDTLSAGSFNDFWYSVNVDYTYDVPPPVVTLVDPVNNSVVTNTNNVTLNFSVVDYNGDLKNCSVWSNISGIWSIDNVVSLTGYSNYSSYSYFDLDDGVYSWNVECCDDLDACTFGESNFTFDLRYNATLNDVSVPNVTLISPLNDTELNTLVYDETFICNVSDDVNIENISLFITNSSGGNFALNQTITDIFSTNYVARFNVTLVNGSYLWNCGAYDSAGNLAFASDNWSIILNYTVNYLPTLDNITLKSTFGTNFTFENLTANLINVSDLNHDFVKEVYNWYLNGTSITVLNMPFEGGSLDGSSGGTLNGVKDYSGFGNNGTVFNDVTWTRFGGRFNDGKFDFDADNDYISVSNDDTLGQSGLNEFTISAWIYPRDDSQYNDLLGTTNDWNGNGFNFYLRGGQTGQEYAFTIDGQYVRAGDIVTDTWHNLVGTYNGSSMVLYLDGVEVGRNDGGKTGVVNNNDGDLTIGIINGFSYGTDFNGSISDVKMFNRSLSANQISLMFNGYDNIISSDETLVGDVWKSCVTLNDGVGDGNETCSNNLTIIEDLIAPNVTLVSPVNNSNITSNFVTLNVNVTDNIMLSNCTVWTNFSGSFVSNSTVNVSGISNSSSWSFSDILDGYYVWNVNCCDSFGNCAFADDNFTFIVNTTGVVNESIYQIFYGNTSMNVVLGRDSDLMYDFGNSNSSFVFIYDVDSVIDFDSLQSVGYGKDNISSSNDFREIDTLLDLSSTSTGIDANYTGGNGSVALNIMNLSVSGRVINNVPYVYSGNSSSFITGILWDMSDSSDNEFDSIEKEDLVFVSLINNSMVGDYGVYDYEAKIPANLTGYKSGVDKVELIME